MRTGDWIGLAVILLLAALLRLPGLDRTSLWYDEAVSWSQSKDSLRHLFSSVAADNYPPLHNLLLWLVMPVIGDSEIALRLPSAVASLMSIGLVFLIGKRVFDVRTGLTAALLLAISPFHLWYATEARMYALFDMTGLAFLLSLVGLLQTGRRAWVAAVAVFGAAFLYSHIYAAFAFAAVGTGLLAGLYAGSGAGSRKRYLAALSGLIGAAILFLPWLIILAGRARAVSDEGFWIAWPDFNFLTVMVRDMAGSEYLFLLFLGFALVAIIGPLFSGRHKTAPKAAPGLMLVLASFSFGPPLIAYILSITVQPILFDRYLISAWSALILLASAGALRLLPRAALLVLPLAALALSYPALEFSLTTKIRPEWRIIAERYLEQRQTSDEVILFKGFAAPALAYYLRDKATIVAADDPGAIGVALGTAGETFLLIAHSNPFEMQAALDTVPARFTETGRWRAFGWGASGLTLMRFSAPEK